MNEYFRKGFMPAAAKAFRFHKYTENVRFLHADRF